MPKPRTLLSTSILLGTLLSSATALAVLPPYTEDFETEPTCGTACAAVCTLSTSGWTNVPTSPTTDDLDWAVDVGGTTSGGTGPSVDHNPGNAAGRYLYTESSSPCNAGGLEALLISPPLELTGSTIPVGRFWYHMLGATQGTLHVDVLDSAMNVVALDVIPSVTANVDLWQESAVIALTPYIALGTVHIRIRGVLGAGFTSDMAIDDFRFFDAGLPDLSIVSIDSPLPVACGLANEQVTVTIANTGADVTGFAMAFDVDGGTTVNETSTALVPGGGTVTYTFTALGNFSAPGLHTLSATVTAAGDANAANNNITGNVVNGRNVATFPASEDFEGATAADWTAGGANSSWALGTPANPVITGAASGTNAWATNLTGLYNANEQSAVQSTACYSMTNLTSPTIQMSVWWESELSWDGANVQYSIDGGANWVTIGTVGDPVNWYTDDTINGAPGGDMVGWTGRNGTGSPGWVTAIHGLPALAGAASVNFRVNFGSDGSVQDDGFAFDDFTIFESVPAVEVTQVGPLGAVGAVAANTTDVLTQELDFFALGAGSRPVTSITVTNSGTIPDADITAVRIHLDDGDGVFDPVVDTLLGAGTFSAGISTITTVGLNIPSFQTARAFVSVDVGSMAPAGAFIGTEIADATLDIITGDASPVTATNLLLGPMFGIQGLGMIPLTDDFSNGIPARTVQLAPGVYPGATAAGTTTTLEAATTNSALIEILPSNGALLPQSGTGFIAITFPNGRATGAVDYVVDLSAYDATVDPIWVAFSYTDTGEELDPEDNVFVSLDGGATWFGSLFRFDWTAPQSTWTSQTADLSGLVASGGGTFTSSVVIRFQAQDDFDIGSDGLLIDSVLVGEAQRALIERPIATVIPDDSADLIGPVPPAAQTLEYTVRNSGHFPLVVTASVTAANNAVITAVTGPTMLAATSTGTIQIDYVPSVGAFDFVLIVATDDPRDTDGVYTVAVSGTGGTPEADIDIQRPAGTSIASGGADAVGTVPALAAQTLTYTVVNQGLAPLMVNGVVAANETNVTLTQSPYTGMLTSGQSATFDIGYTTMAPGAFGFDITVTSNDMDEGTYTISVTGDAVAPEIEIERGGNVIASGDTDTQPRTDVGVPVQLDYDVFNRGTADLTVSSISLANLMSVTASVTTSTASFVVAPNGSATIGVSYVLTAPGAFSFDVEVVSDDTDEGTYTIAVAGESTGPDISVTRGGAAIPNGGTDDLGAQVPGEPQTLTYTIGNDGTSVLTIATTTANAEMNVMTTVTEPSPLTVAAGATTTFTVEYTPTANGAFSFGMDITSDDPDESPYTFVASGTAMAAGQDGGVTPPRDGGVTPMADGGAAVPDAGTKIAPTPEDDGGCGCEATKSSRGTFGGSAFVLLMIGGLLVVRRR